MYEKVQHIINELRQSQSIDPGVEQALSKILDVVRADEEDYPPTELSRFANELHDTVSQTLWSISLIAERLPSIWKLNRKEGERSLITLHQLAQSALSERRSLLLELRPSKLVDAKLSDLIRHLATSISKRSGLAIAVTIPAQEPLPPDVQVILYRVTHGALSHIVHHASATYVEIHFNSHDGHVELTIQDNGHGFDLTHVAPEHLGLSIMSDHIKSIGGSLEISSQKDEGTLIKVRWNDIGDQKRL